MGHNPGGDNKSPEMNKMGLHYKKCKDPEKEQVPSITERETETTTKSRFEGKKVDDDSNGPRFADEDYIVFCFTEDGAIHVVKDGKPGEAFDRVDNRFKQSSTMPVYRKLTYSEYAEKGYNTNHDYMAKEDEREIFPTNEGDYNMGNKKGKVKWRVNSDTEGVFGGENNSRTIEEETKECEMVVSGESSDHSNHSDGSSSSFAFPILTLEGVDSPVQMPKPEPLQFRKHRARAAILHCCKF